MDSFSNVTSVPEAGNYGTAKLILRATFVSVTAALSIVSNAICIFVLPRVKAIPENNRLFLLSLSVSDIGIGVGAFIYIIPAASGQWVFSDVFCDCVNFAMSLFGAVSIVSLICITVDKYIAIMKPLRYIQLVTRKRVLGVIIGTWILCAVNIATVYSPLLIGPPVSYQISAAACGPDFTGSDFISVFLTILIGVTTVLLPLTSISLIYMRLYQVTRRQIRELQARLALTQDDFKKKRQLSGEGKAIRMFATITVTYAIVWTPYFVAILYTNVTMTVVPWLHFMGFWLIISGSWCDAAILAAMNTAFRKTARQLIHNFLRRVGVVFRNKQTAPMDDISAADKSLQVTELAVIDA